MPTPSKTNSLFEQHLRMMDGQALADDGDEARRVAGMRLPALQLKRTRTFALRGVFDRLPHLGLPYAALFALATLCAFLLVRVPAPDVLQQKGGTRVSLVWQRGDTIMPWHQGSEARDGDRFSAEVVADRPLAAFLGIYDRGGRLLSDPRLMLTNHIELAPGERANFSNGFELTAADEGEEAAVFTCDLAAFKAAQNDPLVFVERLVSVGGCPISRFRLR